ncbi:hypothetical protein [Catenulispora yoronensis]|uniref:hypothetical protein n=1 Tax=Catenulispora yoronensis TaxID=450799 RepID=UPI0031DF1226
MHISKRNSFKLGVTTAASALGLGVLGTATASAASAAPAEPAYGKTHLTTVINQWTHWSTDPNASSHAGELHSGSNYFYCWTVGTPYHGKETDRTSAVWLLTDDDAGHRGVWVNDVYLDEWGFAHDTDVLPHC